MVDIVCCGTNHAGLSRESYPTQKAMWIEWRVVVMRARARSVEGREVEGEPCNEWDSGVSISPPPSFVLLFACIYFGAAQVFK